MINIILQFDTIFNEKVRLLIMRYLGNDAQARSLLYTIESGKNRFRSGLSYLLSGETETGIAIGAASEIAWAAILILDDIGDNTWIRRGKSSAWRKFGLLESSHAASLGFIIANLILKEKAGSFLGESLEKNIELTLRAQIEQGVFDITTSAAQILKNYFGKTALGRWAIEAGVEVNTSLGADDKKLIKDFSEKVAVAAQIRNDLDDFLIDAESEKYEPSMKDLRDETINYVSALFFETASTEDKVRFLGECWGQKVFQQSQVAQGAREILGSCGIFERCESEIRSQIEVASSLICSIPEPHRNLLINWARNYEERKV